MEGTGEQRSVLEALPDPPQPPQGEGLTLGTSKEEVVARVGAGLCVVKTLTPTHLYCEPPPVPPGSLQPAPFVVSTGEGGSQRSTGGLGEGSL